MSRTSRDGEHSDTVHPVVTTAGPEAVAAWHDFLAGLAHPSSGTYRWAAGRFLRWLETRATPLSRVTAELVAEYLNGSGLRPSTRTPVRSILRRLFAALKSHGILSSNPIDEVKPLKAESRRAPPVALAELKGYVHELALDPVEEGTEEFDAALLLLAGLHLGTRRVLPLSRFTGVKPSRAAVFAERLRANGVWTSDGKTAGGWVEENGQLAFWLDVWVAEGLLELRTLFGDERQDGRSDKTVVAP